jgi:hypothetical protein
MQQVLERLHKLPAQQHEPISNKLAAVLVALFEAEDGVVRVWLTQRAQHLNSHQGGNPALVLLSAQPVEQESQQCSSSMECISS